VTEEPDTARRLSVQHTDALWDAVAIPGPQEPTFTEQHQRVCAAVADILDEMTPQPVDRAALLREVADDCDEAGGKYAGRALNEHAAAAFDLMEHFQRKANEAEYVATPCSVGGCEPGGEPCGTHERLMAHAEGDHELCNPYCATPDGELRRLAAEATPEPATHSCGNCDGVDPDTCFMNPDRPPEQCPAAGFVDYGQQCAKPVGHHLHTFEEQPPAVVQPQPDDEHSCAEAGCSGEPEPLPDDTQCGPAPDECDDEPCVNHERQQSHRDNDHSLCSRSDCEVLRQS